MDVAEISEVLGDSALLAGALATISKSMGPVAATITDGERLVSECTTPAWSEKFRINVGCVAKCLTAALVHLAIKDGAMKLHTRFLDAAHPLVASPVVLSALDGVNVAHILTHTHGLDDPSCDTLPRDTEGLINSQALFASFGNLPRLADPGALYRYSNVGSWLAALLLERLYTRRFSVLIDEHVLRPAGELMADRDAALCPSTGTSISMSSESLARFAQSSAWMAEASTDGRPDFASPLPKWPPAEGLRSVLAWFEYRDGCFGHRGVSPDGAVSCAVRVNPRERAGLGITAQTPAGARAALVALGKNFGGVEPIRLPKILSKKDRLGLNTERYVGRFRNSFHDIHITSHGEGLLKGTVLGIGLERYYLPAGDDLFIPVVPEPTLLPALYFIGGDQDGPHYLLTGRSAFRRYHN